MAYGVARVDLAQIRKRETTMRQYRIRRRDRGMTEKASSRSPNPKAVQVIQTAHESLEVTDSICIRIHEGTD